MATQYAYTMPPAQCLGDDKAANLAFFLLENVGNVCGKWAGPMRAADQRTLMGRFIGKGHVVIDGSNEYVNHNVSVCFGTMRDTQATYFFRDL